MFEHANKLHEILWEIEQEIISTQEHQHQDLDDDFVYARDKKKYLRSGFAFVYIDWFSRYLPFRLHTHFADGKHTYIELMMTHPQTNSQGVGVAMIKYIGQWADERGSLKVWLDAWAGNGEKLV